MEDRETYIGVGNLRPRNKWSKSVRVLFNNKLKEEGNDMFPILKALADVTVRGIATGKEKVFKKIKKKMR